MMTREVKLCYTQATKLFKNKGDEMRTLEIQGYEQDDPSIVKLLIDSNNDLNEECWRPDTATFFETKATLLYVACFDNKPRIVKALLEAGANPEIKGKGSTPLMIACKMGHRQVVKELLAFNVKLQTTNNNSQTPLFIAYAVNEQNIIRQLHAAGADFSDFDDQEETVLTYACKHAALEVVKRLLEAGANPNQKNAKGESPLFLVLRQITQDFKVKNHKKFLAIFKLLIKYGVDIFNEPVAQNLTAYSVALGLGFEAIQNLIEVETAKKYYSHYSLLSQSIASLNLQLKAAEHAESMNSALNIALKSPFTFHLAKQYLQNGASLDEEDSPWNRLLVACLNNNLDEVKKLLSTNIARDEEKDHGTYPLDIAYFNGNKELIKILQDHKIPDFKKSTYSQLALASMFDQKVLVNNLLTSKQIQEDRLEALIFAITLGHNEIVKMLLSLDKHLLQAEIFEEAVKVLSMSGNIQLLDDLVTAYKNVHTHKTSPLLIAAMNNQHDLAMDQINKGAKLNIKGMETGRAPLYWACVNGDSILVKALLDNGAEMSKMDKKSYLSMSIKEGNLPLMQCILFKEDQIPKVLNRLLLEASAHGQLPIVRYLIKAHANVNATDSTKNTALHKAIENNHVDVIRELLKHGANPRLKNGHKVTAIDMAYRLANIPAYDMLNLADGRPQAYQPTNDDQYESAFTSKSSSTNHAINITEIDRHLTVIRAKANELKGKSNNNSSYIEAAEVAEKLVTTLNNARNDYDKNKDGIAFKNRCLDAINDPKTKTVLEQHRGWRGILAKIGNAIINALSLNLAPYAKSGQGLFSQVTDSAKKLKEFEISLNEGTQDKKHGPK